MKRTCKKCHRKRHWQRFIWNDGLRAGLSERCCDCRGNQCYKRPRSFYAITHHARRRFVERVFPGLDEKQSLIVMHWLMAGQEPVADPPAWSNCYPRKQGYVEVGPGVLFVLRRPRQWPRSRPVVITVLTREEHLHDEVLEGQGSTATGIESAEAYEPAERTSHSEAACA